MSDPNVTVLRKICLTCDEPIGYPSKEEEEKYVRKTYVLLYEFCKTEVGKAIAKEIEEIGKGEYEKFPEGLSKVAFGKLRNAYEEEGYFTPEMMDEWVKCDKGQRDRLLDISKRVRKKKDENGT